MKKNLFYTFIILALVFGFSFFVGTQKTEATDLYYFLMYTKTQSSSGIKAPVPSVEFSECNKTRTEFMNSAPYLQSKNSNFKEGVYVAIPSFCIKETNPFSSEPSEVQNIEGQNNKPKDDTYTLLAPLGNLKTAPKNIGDYFNIIFNLAIGLCAVLAVVMIVIGGVQYMGDESIFGKTEAKSKIFSAVLGLIIALGSYALLNTINPDLLGKNGLKITPVFIEDFSVSGGASFDGSAIKINFNKEAYPAAKTASQKTGVETAFILAMFDQETSSGSNTGNCNYKNANMANGQLNSLKEVAKRLNLNYEKINMSCSGGGSTHGGAIGYTQFLPGTWLEYANEAKTILGHEPNPWNTADALMMTALFLKNKGGSGTSEINQINAACKYFGSCTTIISCGNNISGSYGQCIVVKKKLIQIQIDEAIKKGEIN